MKTLLLAALTLLPVTVETRVVDDSQEVASIIKTAVDEVVGVLRETSLTRVQKREKAMAIVEPLIDFQLLAMLSLGKTHWSSASESQRERFSDLFAQTLKLSYFEKLELFTDEDVEFEPPVQTSTKGTPKFFVMSTIVSKGDRIGVGYHVTRRDDTWKVYDFEIEGVSIRKSYGSQYSDYLKENSFDDLLRTMQEKVDEVKSRDGESMDSKR